MSLKNRFTKSSNPFMKEESFAKSTGPIIYSDGDIVSNRASTTMTTSGAVNKTFILAGLLMVTTFINFQIASPILTFGGAILGLGAVIWASFKPEKSTWLAPTYALLEGLFVGGISAMYATMGGGLIFHAVTITLGLLFAMLFLYKSGLIKVTQKFRSAVMMATGAILVVYVIDMVMRMFGASVPFLHEGGMMGIGISLFIIGIASFNLLLDFDFFEKGEQMGAPKHMEWFAGMGLIVTLVWIYVEVLRLVSILAND